MEKKRSGGRKRELPITGILAGIVLILLIGLGVLVGLTQKNESRQKEEQRKKQTEAVTERQVGRGKDEMSERWLVLNYM